MRGLIEDAAHPFELYSILDRKHHRHRYRGMETQRKRCVPRCGCQSMGYWHDTRLLFRAGGDCGGGRMMMVHIKCELNRLFNHFTGKIVSENYPSTARQREMISATYSSGAIHGWLAGWVVLVVWSEAEAKGTKHGRLPSQGK